MIDVRIVCAHDALPLAEAITRLLEAEGRRVRTAFGRQSLDELDDARGACEAVLMIWSPNARSQTYMHAWAQAIDPARLIEVAHGASDWPAIKRKAPVIDFAKWRGQRGARCWRALGERLVGITNILVPPKPPLHAIAAAGAAGLAVVSGAVALRLHTTAPNDIAGPPMQEAAVADELSGVGGPLEAIEPASMEDGVLRIRRHEPLPLIEATPTEPLAELPEAGRFELRDPTLLERLNDYNPLRRGARSEE